MPRRLAQLVSLAVASTLVTVAQPIHAQDVRDEWSADQQTELDSIEAQKSLAVGLYVASGILTAAGIVTLLGGSIATLTCTPPDDCSGAEIAIGGGAAAAAAGFVLLLIATFVDQGADGRRRQLLRDSLVLTGAPTRGGAMLWLGGRFH